MIPNNIAVRGAAQGAPAGMPRGTIGGRAVSICRTQNGPGWHVYSNALHMLPHRFKIPSMFFVQFVVMWLTGDQEKGAPPLRNVTVYH